jgi:hypothetical protein
VWSRVVRRVSHSRPRENTFQEKLKTVGSSISAK